LLRLELDENAGSPQFARASLQFEGPEAQNTDLLNAFVHRE
jgi:hypothetical protein